MADLVSKSSLNVAAQPDLDEILVPVREGLKLVEQEIAEIAQVDFPILGSLLEYVLSSKGKRIRPAVVLLAGGFGANPTERLFKLGAAIELMHTATLILSTIPGSGAECHLYTLLFQLEPRYWSATTCLRLRRSSVPGPITTGQCDLSGRR